jgi:succinate dehydrogenase flavin-adding protein (antitoxin of CptAB toxin-antitoxin module)
VRELPAHPLVGGVVHRTSATPPSLLPPGEKGASRSANDARRYDRLRWRSRRGLLELDVVLKEFLDRHYPGLTPAEQEAFEQLLMVPDETLLAYVQGKQDPPEKELMQLVTKIRN